jgi:hypothetical protein
VHGGTPATRSSCQPCRDLRLRAMAPAARCACCQRAHRAGPGAEYSPLTADGEPAVNSGTGWAHPAAAGDDQLLTDQPGRGFVPGHDERQLHGGHDVGHLTLRSAGPVVDVTTVRWATYKERPI